MIFLYQSCYVKTAFKAKKGCMDIMEKKLNREQEKAFKEIVKPGNVFITGNAGTGKSFLLNKVITYYEKTGLNVVITAPTGIAALNVGGTTIHRAFHAPVHPIGPKEYIKTPEAIVKADVIIIDEISMVRFDLMEYISASIEQAQKISKKAKKLIVVGDFYQLAPVMNSMHKDTLENLWQKKVYEGYAFESTAWKKMNFKNIVLTTTVRQKDGSFVAALNSLREGNIEKFGWLKENSCEKWQDDAIYLCGTNKEVDMVNHNKLIMLNTPEIIFQAQITGKVNDGDKMTDEYLHLKVGAKIMTLVNDKQNRYKNGSIGTITQIREDSIVVEIDGVKNITIEPYAWTITEYSVEGGKLQQNIIGIYEQLPVKLAYAITIHKSQGKTFEKLNINPKCFANGQLYVALSRGTDIKKIHLKDKINRYWLKTSSEVLNFYMSI